MKNASKTHLVLHTRIWKHFGTNKKLLKYGKFWQTRKMITWSGLVTSHSYGMIRWHEGMICRGQFHTAKLRYIFFLFWSDAARTPQYLSIYFLLFKIFFSNLFFGNQRVETLTVNFLYCKFNKFPKKIKSIYFSTFSAKQWKYFQFHYLHGMIYSIFAHSVSRNWETFYHVPTRRNIKVSTLNFQVQQIFQRCVQSHINSHREAPCILASQDTLVH